MGRRSHDGTHADNTVCAGRGRCGRKQAVDHHTKKTTGHGAQKQGWSENAAGSAGTDSN